MSASFRVPAPADLDEMYRALRNWDRWGPGDERGALNYIGPAERAAAARLVESGETVSLAHDLDTNPSPENPTPVHHHMLASGDALDANGIPRYEAARDYVGFDIHGLTTTHVDALSHMFVDGMMFGGRPATEVRSDGARANTVMSMAEGVVGRGVLLDVPRALGADYLGAGEAVTVDDLEAAIAAQAQVVVRRGDILLVRWGRGPRRRSEPRFTGFSGLHPDCLPWIHAHEVAVLGSDGISDPMPDIGVASWPFPVHQIGITGMGLHLIDNMDLDGLARACAGAGRWEFLFMMAPLRIPRGTGSAVNPVAVM